MKEIIVFNMNFCICLSFNILDPLITLKYFYLILLFNRDKKDARNSYEVP